MKELLKQFPKDLNEAIKIAEAASFKSFKGEINNVVICGMGGSGIGGTIASQIIYNSCKLPVVCCKSYQLPAFANKNTLVIASSYSGNTEETISCIQQAGIKNCEVVVLTSGGVLLDIAKQKGYNYIQIPSGQPPRSAFGYSFPQLFFILKQYDVIASNHKEDFLSSATLIEKSHKEIVKEAEKIAHQLKGKIPVIYAETFYSGVAVRFRQQLNENSKTLCWHHAIPEMNHNELVGWDINYPFIAPVFLVGGDESSRNNYRIDINKEIISPQVEEIITIKSKGHNRIERTLYLINICDWVSLFLAELNDADPELIKNIVFLKSKLSEIPLNEH